MNSHGVTIRNVSPKTIDFFPLALTFPVVSRIDFGAELPAVDLVKRRGEIGGGNDKFSSWVFMSEPI